MGDSASGGTTWTGYFPYELRWREFLPRLLEYAVFTGFLHRSGRTVHEQILLRLERKSRRVNYHDMVEGGRHPQRPGDARGHAGRSGRAARAGCLFVDPVLCVATKSDGVLQHREIEMPFVVQRPHFILSSYFDYVSFPFNKMWRYPAKDILGMMIKLADSPAGTISKRSLGKALTDQDKQRLSEGVEICKEILCRFSGKQDHTFLGTINAGHPGGMLPLTKQEAESFHHRRLPGNLYVADATLFPQSLGNPPILTIIAMAKRVSRMCAQMAA
jgi:hypothetical protein